MGDAARKLPAPAAPPSPPPANDTTEAPLPLPVVQAFARLLVADLRRLPVG